MEGIGMEWNGLGIVWQGFGLQIVKIGVSVFERSNVPLNVRTLELADGRLATNVQTLKPAGVLAWWC